MKAKTPEMIFAAALASGFFGMCISAPVRSMLGADETGKIAEEESGLPYVADGLVNWWDGLDGLWSDDSWMDIVGMHEMVFSPQEDGYAGIKARPNSRVQSVSSGYHMDMDFTLHCLLETVKRSNWQNWCQIGIGRKDGLENGFVLMGISNPMAVQYRKDYSGTVFNSVPLTGILYGDTIGLDIVFHYATLTYEVYVNGILMGISQISEENWNLDEQTGWLGTDFYALDDRVNSNLKRYNVLFYNRALNAEEIEYNFNVDKERFGL